MAFTRFHDDDARIIRQLQQQTDQGRWVLDVPGPGDKPCFALDPMIISQKWGGNAWTNMTDLHSSLLGINRSLNRDIIDPNHAYRRTSGAVYSSPIDYPVCETFLTTEQSRAIMSAWTARDLAQNHGDYLFYSPQAHVEMPFSNYTNTRLAEKDKFAETCLKPLMRG